MSLQDKIDVFIKQYEKPSCPRCGGRKMSSKTDWINEIPEDITSKRTRAWHHKCSKCGKRWIPKSE